MVDFASRQLIIGPLPTCRLLKLTELSALSLSSLEVLVLDLHRDAKGLTVVDIPETRYVSHAEPF